MNSNGSWNSYADLDAYGAQAAPEHAFRPGIDTLANGDYEFEVENAALDQINSMRVMRLNLKVLPAARQVEQVYWLNRQEGVNGLLAEMAALGFPAHTWGSGPGKTPLSVAIPDCVGRLRGVRFRGSKTSRPGKQGGQSYHDLHISGRLGGAPMPPVTPTPSPNGRPGLPPQPVPMVPPTRPAGTYDSNDIPF